MSNVITSGKVCPETRAKFNIALKYIKRQKKNNTMILSITYRLCKITNNK